MDSPTGNSEYREFRPPLPLAEHFLCLWTETVSSPAGYTQRVLPDCCADILLVNGIPTVVGPWTEFFLAPLAPGTKIIAARCHPGLTASLLGVPASELLNRSVPLREVWGSAETARFARIADERSFSAQMSAMEAALIERVANSPPADEATLAAIQWIAQHPQGRVEQLSKWLGWSSRQIQRRFTTAVGYGPKLFHSVFRFQRLLHLAARTGVQRNLAELAADAGYSDQAHMTREVQRFSGKPPSLLLQSSACTLRLSSLI